LVVGDGWGVIFRHDRKAGVGVEFLLLDT
jgi:hypothetical protein